MGKPLPSALRERVAAFVDEGHGEAARHLRVSPRFVNELMKFRRETGSLTPRGQQEHCKNTLDSRWPWRHGGAMSESADPPKVRVLDRINLRLSAETFHAIDMSRGKRAGNVSRNTWIAEAIEEKLARETAQAEPVEVGRAANG